MVNNEWSTEYKYEDWEVERIKELSKRKDTEITRLESDVAKLRKIRESLNDRIDSLQDQIIKSPSADNTELDKQIKQLQKDKKQVQADLEEKTKEVDKWKNEAGELQTKLTTTEKDLADANTKLTTKDKELTEKEKELTTANTAKTKAEADKATAEAATTAERNKVADRDRTIASKNTEIQGYKDTLATKDRTITSKNNEIARKDTTITEKNNTIAARDKTIAEQAKQINAYKKDSEELKKLKNPDHLLPKNLGLTLERGKEVLKKFLLSEIGSNDKKTCSLRYHGVGHVFFDSWVYLFMDREMDSMNLVMNIMSTDREKNKYYYSFHKDTNSNIWGIVEWNSRKISDKYMTSVLAYHDTNRSSWSQGRNELEIVFDGFKRALPDVKEKDLQVTLSYNKESGKYTIEFDNREVNERNSLIWCMAFVEIKAENFKTGGNRNINNLSNWVRTPEQYERLLSEYL